MKDPPNSNHTDQHPSMCHQLVHQVDLDQLFQRDHSLHSASCLHFGFLILPHQSVCQNQESGCGRGLFRSYSVIIPIIWLQSLTAFRDCMGSKGLSCSAVGSPGTSTLWSSGGSSRGFRGSCSGSSLGTVGPISTSIVSVSTIPSPTMRQLVPG